MYNMRAYFAEFNICPTQSVDFYDSYNRGRINIFIFLPAPDASENA
jgi:hypothetical protein